MIIVSSNVALFLLDHRMKELNVMTEIRLAAQIKVLKVSSSKDSSSYKCGTIK